MLSPQPGIQFSGSPVCLPPKATSCRSSVPGAKEVGSRAPCEATLGVICSFPAATGHCYLHHPDRWALSQGAPLALPGDSQDDSPCVPGTRHEPMGPSSSHPRPVRRDPRAARRGPAPRLPALSGRSPTTGTSWGRYPRGGGQSGGVPEYRRGDAAARWHTKEAAGRRGGAGRGWQEGAGARRAAIKPPPRRPLASAPGCTGCSRYAKSAGATASSFSDPPPRLRRHSPASGSPPRRHPASARQLGSRARAGEYGLRAPADPGRLGPGGGGEQLALPLRWGQSLREPPAPCGVPSPGREAAGRAGPGGGDVEAEELSQPPSGTAAKAACAPRPLRPGTREGPGGARRLRAPGRPGEPAAGSPGDACFLPVHPSWRP